MGPGRSLGEKKHLALVMKESAVKGTSSEVFLLKGGGGGWDILKAAFCSFTSAPLLEKAVFFSELIFKDGQINKKNSAISSPGTHWLDYSACDPRQPVYKVRGFEIAAQAIWRAAGRRSVNDLYVDI